MTIAGTPRLRWLVGLLLAVVVTRIPLLLAGYSSDPDAWWVAYAGKMFWETGNYIPSRLPGYPLHEIISGPFVLLGGSFLSNISTLIASLFLLVVWYHFVERETASPRILTLLLAFTPLVWVDSAATLDYVWSLLCIFLSLSAVRQKKVIAGGIWLGCAIGFRSTNAVAVVPLSMLLYLSSVPRRAFVMFILSAIASSLVAFSPVLFTYGLAGWIQQTLSETSDAHLPFMQRMLSFGYRTVYSLGLFATLALVIILWTRRHKMMVLLQRQEPLVVGSVAGVVTFLALFAVFPLDRSYLLPAFPFLFLIVESISTRRALIAFACCVISFGFVNPDVTQHTRPSNSPQFNLHTGLVIEEWQRRTRWLMERDAIPSLPIKGKAVLMVGTSPSFWFENERVEIDSSEQWSTFGDIVTHSKVNPDLHFISGLSLKAVHDLQAEGYALYCVDWLRYLWPRWHGYDPVSEGITMIGI